MKNFFLLWVLCLINIFAQYNIQSLNPGVNYGSIHQVFYQHDTSVVFLSSKANTVSVYRINPLNAASPTQELFSLNRANYYFTSPYLKFLDNNVGFFVLGSATGASQFEYSLYRTTNGGATWSTLTFLNEFTGIDFRNSLEGFYCGLNGKLLRTSNGGSAWTTVPGMNLPHRNYRHIAVSRQGLTLVASGDSIWGNTGITNDWDVAFITSTPDDEVIKLQSYAMNFVGSATRLGSIGKHSVSPGGTLNGVFANVGITNIAMASFSDSAIGLLTTNSDSLYLLDAAFNHLRYLQRGTSNVMVRSLNRILLVAYSNVLKISENGVNNLREINGLATTVAEVDFITSSVGYTAGGFGQSLKTTDGGKSWKRIYDSAPYNAVSVKSLSENIVILHLVSSNTSSGYTNGFLVRSIDGGTTWRQITNPADFKVYGYQFLDALNGYVSGLDGKFYVTNDGGLNWTEIASFPSTYIYSFYFLNSTTGWLSTGSILYKTTNGGVVWDSTFATASFINKPFFERDSIGFSIIGYGETYLYKSTNGGATWNYLPSFRELTFKVIDELNIYKTNVYGQTYHSTDGGNNWTYVPTEDLSNTTHLDVINKRTLIFSNSYRNTIGRLINSNGYVLSVPGVYAVSGDTIDIPIEVSVPTGRKFQAIQFNLSGYTDKLEFLGTNFTNTLLGGTEWVHSVNPASNTIRFAASAPSSLAESGTILKLRFKIIGTASGQIPLKFSSVVFNNGLVPADTVNGWVKLEQVNLGDVDLNGTVQAFDASLVLQYLTLPGGIPLSSLQQRNANVTTDNTISALDASVILRYVTGIVTSLPYSGSGAAAGFAGMNDQQSAPGSLVEIPVRINNGNNLFSFEGTFNFDETLLEFNSIQWQPIVSSFMKEYRQIGTKIYFAGAGLDKLNNIQGEVVAKLYFTVKPNPTQNHTQVTLEKFRMNENPVVLNAAASGVSIITGVENETGAPVVYALGQNYPNPFNPSTTIKYALPQEGRVVLELYDIMGKKVALLLDENKEPGYHSIQFNTTDIKGLTSGVYFYRINAGSFIDTKKLMLMK